MLVLVRLARSRYVICLVTRENEMESSSVDCRRLAWYTNTTHTTGSYLISAHESCEGSPMVLWSRRAAGAGPRLD